MARSRRIRFSIFGVIAAALVGGGLFVSNIADAGNESAQAPEPESHALTYHGGYGLYPTAR